MSIRDDFNTTYLGIQRSVEDAQEAFLCDNEEGLSYDEILLGQLELRAGTFLGSQERGICGGYDTGSGRG